MNLVNIVQHLDLTKAEFGSEATTTTRDIIFASQQLFEIFKTFQHSYFSELHTYHPLEFDDKYDAMIDEEESSDESDDYEENQEQVLEIISLWKR
ncbi:unnamed protein product [Rotaria socialis]|uniref:Uncharacterized protein n=1 Tax=Rotaria socialis TaxID=392032 RepID=A0A818KG41_9BILA|nr:unnamed protein product [Rotaria socialis]CAF3774776.1 unnamed protein product [Rotaria socialis]CAF4626270.1 unnamed protein product [Rotaria socialis]CAF4857266.1 unnamed protein product [Rotaria socialis]